MRYTLITFTLIFSQFISCAQEESFQKMLNDLYEGTVPFIKTQALKSDLEHEDVLILDTREKKEYAVSHISKAKFAGYEKFNESVLKGVDKNTKIVVYCSVGYRSERIGERLKEMGYNNVYNLYGGIFEWVNQGNMVEDINGDPTNKTHTYSKKWGKWLEKGEKVY